MAKSETFKLIYSCEFAYWTQGMPLEMYNQMLKSYNMQGLPVLAEHPKLEKQVTKDISDAGKYGVTVLKDLGIIVERPIKNCNLCHICEKECPEGALEIISNDDGKMYQVHDSQKCLGVSCERCVHICPRKLVQFKNLKVLNVHESPLVTDSA